MRLQQIERTNGSIVHSVNIPLEVIEDTHWKKGDELSIKSESLGTDGVYRIVIVREKDIPGTKEEEHGPL